MSETHVRATVEQIADSIGVARSTVHRAPGTRRPDPARLNPLPPGGRGPAGHGLQGERGALDPVAHRRRGGQLVVGVAQRGEHPAGLAGRVGCGGTHLGGGLLGHAPSMGRQPAR